MVPEPDFRKQAAPEHGGAARSAHFWSWARALSKHRDGLAALRFLPVYFAAAVLFFFLLWTVVSSLVPPQMPKLWQQTVAEIILLVAAIAPALAIAHLEARSFGSYGLPLRVEFARLLGVGGLMGLAALSLLLAALRIIGCVSFHGVHLHGLRVWKFALFWALFFSLVALFEEFAFRGYFLFALSRASGFWPAALISSAIFGYTHHSNRGETWLGALGAGIIGLFFSFTIRRTGNLWFAVGMHASWNWGQTFLYGVPDSGMLEPGHLFQASLYGPSWLSGGSVGPEGSVLLFALIAILWVVFDRLYPRRNGGSAFVHQDSRGGAQIDNDAPPSGRPSDDYHQ